MPYLFSNLKSLGHHPGRHQADKVGFDLKVQVVGVRIVKPTARLWGYDALPHVIASCLIGVGEMIWGVGETLCKLFGTAVEPKLFECFSEGEVVVDIVKKPWFAVPPVLYVTFSPRNGLVVRDEGPLVLELGRCAVNHADRLSGPASHDFIHQDVLREGNLSGLPGGASRQQERGRQYKTILLHKRTVRLWR